MEETSTSVGYRIRMFFTEALWSGSIVRVPKILNEDMVV